MFQVVRPIAPEAAEMETLLRKCSGLPVPLTTGRVVALGLQRCCCQPTTLSLTGTDRPPRTYHSRLCALKLVELQGKTSPQGYVSAQQRKKQPVL